MSRFAKLFALVLIAGLYSPGTAQAAARTYFMYFNTGTVLTQPVVTTNTACPVPAGDTLMGTAPGISLLADIVDATCTPSASRDVIWSNANTFSLYYNGAGYASAMTVTGTSVGIRARGVVAGSILTAKLFYTTSAGAKFYFTGTPGSATVTTTRADYLLSLAGLSATNIPVGSKLGVEFSWTNATGMRLTVNQSASNNQLIVDETAVSSTTTLATGTDPAAATIAPGAAATDVDVFTLITASGTEAITSVTVNLLTSSGVGRLAITNDTGTELGFTTTPVTGSNTITITVAGMSATTTLTTFRVRVTPLSHAAMPVPPGAAYAITAPVTAWAGPNTHAGSDTNPNALTIDNLSPSGATATSGSAGNAKTTLNWVTSASADFALTSGSVVYRWAAASAGTEVPVEGSTPVLGSANGTATVACLVSSSASTPLIRIDGTGGSADCTTAALTNGQAYSYKIFQKDSNGNYDVGVTVGTFTSSFPTVVSINLASPDPTSPATSVDWTVTFSESVTGVDATDFALVEGGGVSGSTITGVTGSGTTWTVTANSGTGAGTLGLNLVDDDTIINAGSIPLSGTGAGNGNFTGQVYTVEYTTSGFVFTDSTCTHGVAFGPGQPCAPVTWSPQIAGQNLTGIYITAVNTSGVPTRLHASQDRTRDMGFGLSCHNPVAHAGVQATFAGVTLPLCQANGATPATWSAVVTVTFPGGVPSSNVSYTFNYADVGLVELWMRNNAVPAEVGTSGAFVVKPGGFVLSGIQQTAAPNLINPAAANAAGAKFVKAGEMFSVTVTATTIGGVTATPNYGNETAAESVMLASALVAPVGGNPSAIGGAFGTFTNGVSTGTAFTWDEVGIINLTPSVADGDYLGAGDVTGTASGNVGRFFPDHFDTAVVATAALPMPCPTGLTCPTLYDGFVYSGQPFSVQVLARNLGGNTTTNYDGTFGFSKAAALTAWDALGGATQNPGGGVLGSNAVAAAAFISGVATLTDTPTYTFGTSPTAPADIYVRALDTDGVTSLRAIPANSVEGGVTVVSGRVKIGNAHGSELLPLPMSATVQYYNETAWVTSTTDDVTSFDSNLSTAGGNLVATIVSGLGGGVVVSNPGVSAVVDGVRAFRLSAPGVRGSANISFNAPDYLPSNTARATFGVYKGNNEFIYLRETY